MEAFMNDLKKLLEEHGVKELKIGNVFNETYVRLSDDTCFSVFYDEGEDEFDFWEKKDEADEE